MTSTVRPARSADYPMCLPAFLIAFAALAGAGLQYRRRPDFHKRLMLLASVTAREAAVTRLPLEFLNSPLAFHAATDGQLLLMIAVDTLRQRPL